MLALVVLNRRRARLPGLVALCLVCALGVAAQSARYSWAEVARWLPDLLVGLVWAGCAAAVSFASRATRTSLLMWLFAATWYSGNFAALDVPVLAALASASTYLHRAVLVHLVLTFPTGRSDSRFATGVVLLTYAVCLIPLATHSSAVSVALGVLTTVAAGLRLRSSYGGARPARAVAVTAAVLCLGALAGSSAVRLAVPGSDELALVVYQLSLAAVGAVLATTAVQRREPGVEVTDVVVDLAGGPGVNLALALGRALGDPTLRLPADADSHRRVLAAVAYLQHGSAR